MPHCNGMDVLEFIRKRSSNTPKVLFISGYSDYSVAEMYNKGVDGFFAKPFRVSAIKDAITKTLLNLNERWKQEPAGHMSLMINKSVDSINPKGESSQIKMGRSGFSVGLNHNCPNEGELVNFEIKIKDNIPVPCLRGQGRVRWAKSEEVGENPPGAGIEIEFVDESCRAKYVDWVVEQNFVPYIPE